MKKLLVVILALILVALPLSAACTPKEVTSPEKPFYEGKTITLIVATKPGGGYDLYGRLVAQFMQKHLPGSTIIVKNVPGAGHIIGTNEIYHSEPDGLTFGAFNRALPLAQVVGLEGVKFNLGEMSWLGSPSVEPYSLVISTKTPWRSLEDMVKAEEVILSSAGVGSQSHVTPLLVAELMGLKNWKVVPGFSGGEGELAMMRGEIHGQFASWSSVKPFVEDGNAVPVMFIATKAIKGYEAVPLIRSVVTKEEYKPVVDVLLSLSQVGRPFAGPPGISQERLQILRQAFDKAVHDPEFVEMAEKLGRPIEYVNGEEAASLMKGLLQLPPEIVQLIKAAYVAEPTPPPAPGAGKVYAIDRISIEDDAIELRMLDDSYWGYEPGSSNKESWTMTVNEGDTITVNRLASSSSRSTKPHAFTIKGLGIDIPLNPGDRKEPYELKFPAGSAGTYEVTSSVDPGLFEGKYKIIVEK